MKKMLCVLIMCLSVISVIHIQPTTAYVTAISATCENTFISALTPVEKTETTTAETTAETTEGPAIPTTQTASQPKEKIINKSKTSPATGNNHYSFTIIAILFIIAFLVFYYKKTGERKNG